MAVVRYLESRGYGVGNQSAPCKVHLTSPIFGTGTTQILRIHKRCHNGSTAGDLVAKQGIGSEAPVADITQVELRLRWGDNNDPCGTSTPTLFEEFGHTCASLSLTEVVDAVIRIDTLSAVMFIQRWHNSGRDNSQRSIKRNRSAAFRKSCAAKLSSSWHIRNSAKRIKSPTSLANPQQQSTRRRKSGRAISGEDTATGTSAADDQLPAGHCDPAAVD